MGPIRQELTSNGGPDGGEGALDDVETRIAGEC